MQKARIKLTSIDIDKLNDICGRIREIAEKTGAELRGPIPLPTQKLRLTTRKATSGDGTASWERYEMRIFKRLIDIGLDERALRLIMRIQIPAESVKIEIEMKSV
jgi:small subunit ribosomal protein S10